MEMIVKLMNNFNKKMIKKSNIFKLNNSVFCDKNWITAMSLGNKLKNDDLTSEGTNIDNQKYKHKYDNFRHIIVDCKQS